MTMTTTSVDAEQDFLKRKRLGLLEQQPHLESRQQEQHALDQEDHEVPEEDALQARCGESATAVPAHVEPAGDGCDHTGAAECSGIQKARGVISDSVISICGCPRADAVRAGRASRSANAEQGPRRR